MVRRPRVSCVQDRPVPWRFRLGLFLLLPVTWLIQAWARRHPAVVETVYSREVYPWIAEVLGTLTGWFGASLAEILLIAASILLVAAGWRALVRIARKRRSLRNVLAHAASSALALAGLLYAWGELGWGLNYHRRPLAESAGLDAAPASAAELRSLCVTLAGEAGALRRQVDEDDHGVMRVLDSPARSLLRARRGYEQEPRPYAPLLAGFVSRPKRVLLPVLPWLHVSGIFAPFTSEPCVAMAQPPADLLAAACHEIAHQLGWAREDEASFVGYLACRAHPDADYRYATTQATLSLVLGALSRADPHAAQEIRADLDPGVLRDWEASNKFWRFHDTLLATAAAQANDSYLKSQGQEAGIESYGLMADLLIGDMRRQSTGKPAR